MLIASAHAWECHNTTPNYSTWSCCVLNNIQLQYTVVLCAYDRCLPRSLKDELGVSLPLARILTSE